jgi:hypothetical protein
MSILSSNFEKNSDQKTKIFSSISIDYVEKSNRGINEPIPHIGNAAAIGHAFVLSGLITHSYPLLLK